MVSNSHFTIGETDEERLDSMPTLHMQYMIASGFKPRPELSVGIQCCLSAYHTPLLVNLALLVTFSVLLFSFKQPSLSILA